MTFGAGRLRRSRVGEAWLGRRPDTAKVAGSNPAEPTLTHEPSVFSVTWRGLGIWADLVFQPFHIRVVTAQYESVCIADEDFQSATPMHRTVTTRTSNFEHRQPLRSI